MNNMWWFPGAMLMLAGLMIAIFPELLSLIVASALLFVGLTWLVGGWQANRWRKQNRNANVVYVRFPW